MNRNEKNRIVLECTVNTRAISGYKTSAGGLTSEKMVRSDQFEELSDADVEALCSAGIQTVIDLRSLRETELVPHRMAGRRNIDYRHIPVLDSETESEVIKIMKPDFRMSDFYIAIIENCKKQIADIFRLLAAAKEGRVMFNCSAGKDRTGIVAAFLLSIAGVSEEDIVLDYALTESNLMEKMPVLKRGFTSQYTGPEEIIDELYSARPENMIRFLGYLKENYTDAENYLICAGLSHEEVNAIRRMMTEGVEL